MTHMSRQGEGRGAGVVVGLVMVFLALFSPVVSLPRGTAPLSLHRPQWVGFPCRSAAPREEPQGMMRLRGGVPPSDEESTEVSTQGDGAVIAAAPLDAAAAEGKAGAMDCDTGDQEDTGVSRVAAAQAGGEAAEGVSEEEAGNGTEEVEAGAAVLQLERPKPTPEIVRQMNERMWEAAQEGNEPLLAKALAGGANVNAFCRGPDRWLNISMGEIAGADDAHTGLNAHWMELNNYTALHLAAACGNAGMIDVLLGAGADINTECLQRVYPFPTQNGGVVPFLTIASPLIFKCTPLRLARAANCGRCFYTSSVPPPLPYPPLFPLLAT